MGERKVLNKYYPPDFDPSKIPRRRQPKNQQIKVRMMLPMSIRCSTCGNYIYQGTKFNSRKEDVIGETYLGIQIFRFYFKCTKCSAEITIKTDPQNSDYTVEAGATRNFEPWRSTDEIIEEAKKKRDAEEMGDAMKALENRTLDSKREMDILAALDEMKSMRARHAVVGTEEMLEALKRSAEIKEKELDEEDEAILRKVIFQNSDKFVRRLEDDDDDGSLIPLTKKPKPSLFDAADSGKGSSSMNSKGSTESGTQNEKKPHIIVKPKGTTMNPASKKSTILSTSQQETDLDKLSTTSNTGLGLLCATYDDDSCD